MDKTTRANVIEIDNIESLNDIFLRNNIDNTHDTRDMDEGPDYYYIYTDDGEYSDKLLKDVCKWLESDNFIYKRKVVNMGTGDVKSRYFVKNSKIKNGDIIRLKQLSGYRNDGLLICYIDQYDKFELLNLSFDYEIDEYGYLPKLFWLSKEHHSYYWDGIIDHNLYVWIDPDWVEKLRSNITFGKIENYGLNGIFTYSQIQEHGITYTIIYVVDDDLSSINQKREFKMALNKYEMSDETNNITFSRFNDFDNINDVNGYVVDLSSYQNLTDDEVIIMRYNEIE